MEYCSSDDSDMELMQIIIQCDEDSDSESENLVLRKEFKGRVNYMTKLNDYEFSYRFRLSKSAVNHLHSLIQPHLSVKSRRNHGISSLHQTLLALRYYALGTMLESVANFMKVSKSSAYRIVIDVSKVIAKFYPNFIVKESHTEKEFFNIAGFPRVHGVIDTTHILIQSPNANIGEEFRNPNGKYSINVQIVCDASLKFQNVIARWPGSTQDSTIFNQSDLKDYCEQGGLGNRWLLGDNGYPCKPYLLTPLLNPSTPSEKKYNEAHMKTRNTIDRCIRVWKKRFPILTQRCRLRLKNTQAVIIATAVLQNIARNMNLEEMEPEISIPDLAQEFNVIFNDNSLQDTSERQLLINNYFET